MELFANAGPDAENRAQDIVTQWLGIPEGYQGSVRFDEEDRAKLVALIMVQNLFGWNVEHDYYFVPDHGQQFLWLDHEGALWCSLPTRHGLRVLSNKWRHLVMNCLKSLPCPSRGNTGWEKTGGLKARRGWLTTLAHRSHREGSMG